MYALLNRWLELFRRRRAQRSYIKKLGPLLRQRYGRSRYYTIAQVRKTVEVSGLNPNYICYGFAEYCSEEDFNAYHESIGETCDYSSMRSELEHSWSVGHGSFVGDSFSETGSHGHGDSGHFGDGGGHGH